MYNPEYSSVSFIAHGHTNRYKRITGFHLQEECCFKFNPENASEFVSSGSVTAKGELAQIYGMKPNTTVFPKDWDAKRVLDEIAKGARENRVVFNDYTSGGTNKRVVVFVNEKLSIIIDTNVHTKDASIFHVSKFKKK